MQLSEVILCVGYLGEKIVERYGDGGPLGVRIMYSFDGPQLPETGGAMEKRRQRFYPRLFLYYTGTRIFPVDYQAVAAAYDKAGEPALMTVFANFDASDICNVWFDDGKIRLYDKRQKLPEMRYIDYGLMICSRQVFDDSPEDVPFDLAEALENLSRKGELAGHEVDQRFYEIGSPVRLGGTQSIIVEVSKASPPYLFP